VGYWRRISSIFRFSGDVCLSKRTGYMKQRYWCLVMITLLADRQWNREWVISMLHSYPIMLGLAQPPIHWEPWLWPKGWNSRIMKLTTNLHIVPAKMAETVPPLLYDEYCL
jgi:disulfide bond formation protein DsbB